MKYPISKYEKDNENLQFYVNGIRILTPDEYQKLKAAIPKDEYKTKLDILLITGMRYAEYLRLYNHQEWYNEKRNIIHLPEEAQLKHKRKQRQRTINNLPSMFSYLLKDFWKARAPPPLESTWNKDLQRWARLANLNPYGISAKTTRKTIESYMISAGIPVNVVCLRQGHDSLTSMNHYQGLAFSDDEVRDIQRILTEWGISK